MDRLERIAQLKAEAKEHRANIAEREAARERDPVAMHDYLLVQRDAGRAELLYRVTETAPTSSPDVDYDAANTDAENQKGWDLWIRRHLDIERRGLLDALERDMAEILAKLHAQREAGEAALRREITELRRELQHAEDRRVAVAEVRRQFAGELDQQRLAERDTRIASLEQRLDMLARFLSLQGLEPPQGVV
jgi:hypothetical protein